MLKIDGIRFDAEWLRRLFGEWNGRREFRSCYGKLYAVCLSHPFDVVGFVQFAREQGAGVLLLHESTPFESAAAAARQAGADYLIYGEFDRIAELAADADGQAPALCQFSSGTTGPPKLIRRSWEEVDREVAAYNERLDAPGAQPVVCVPVSHSFGLISGVLSASARRAEPHIIRDKNPKFAVRTIRETPRALVYAVPFLHHLYETLGGGRPPGCELVSSGAPLTEALLERLRRGSPRVWQQYGCSEAGCIALGGDPSSPFDVGPPLGHQRLSFLPLAADGPDAGLREIVAASGDRVVHTGDIGFADASGSLSVTGRSDDLINVAGLKVVPSEVESVIARMEGVAEAVVYRTKHSVWGEAVQALVVASPGIREQEIKAWCVRHLPGYKVPGLIRLVGEIPKPPSGKISRKLLQEQEESL